MKASPLRGVRLAPCIWLCGLGLFLSPARGDTLVYLNGDRVDGKLVSHANGEIVFQATNFGELRVSDQKASVLPGERPSPAIAGGSPTPASGKGAAPAEKTPTGALSWLGWLAPWKGRVAFATEFVHDSTDRSSIVLEGRLERKWKQDEVKFEPRYEYRVENKVKVTDRLNATANWQHDLGKRFFVMYRPALEWNRSYPSAGVATPYVLLQQDFGVGLKLVDREKQKMRVGVTETLYENWATDLGYHTHASVESAFVEADYDLPWNLKVTERGVFYHSVAAGTASWEDKLELTHRLSKWVTAGLQFQYLGNPSGLQVQGYRKLRFLIGYEF